MRIEGAVTAKFVIGALIAALAAATFFAAVQGAAAALPTKHTLYVGQLTTDDGDGGSIRLKVQGDRETISKVVVRAQPCEGITTVRIVKNVGIAADRMIEGSFGGTKTIAGTTFDLDGSFKSSSKAKGKVFVGDAACGKGKFYEFEATKVSK